MEKSNLENKIVDYLDGKLSKSEIEAFEAQLKTDNDLQQEVKEFKTLFSGFSSEKNVMPSEQLATNFERLLEDEKNNQVKVVSIHSKSTKLAWQAFKIAASITALLGVFIMGRYSKQEQLNTSLAEAHQEVLEYKEATLISLLGNESASKRIQGVQLLEEFDQPDKDIVSALGEKMLRDESTNVRLSAMEALSKFSYSDQVKTIFIRALETENNPSIQVALIEILGQLQEKKAIAPLKRLLEKEETQPFIKKEINNALPKII
jgi:hypothetical protein